MRPLERIGEECPGGSGTRKMGPFSGPKTTGSSPSGPIPVPFGPRKRSHSEAAAAVLRQAVARRMATRFIEVQLYGPGASQGRRTPRGPRPPALPGGAALTLTGCRVIGAGFALPRDAGRRPAFQAVPAILLGQRWEFRGLRPRCRSEGPHRENWPALPGVPYRRWVSKKPRMRSALSIRLSRFRKPCPSSGKITYSTGTPFARTASTISSLST